MSPLVVVLLHCTPTFRKQPVTLSCRNFGFRLRGQPLMTSLQLFYFFTFLSHCPEISHGTFRITVLSGLSLNSLHFPVTRSQTQKALKQIQIVKKM